MIDEQERKLAQAIIDTNGECIRLRDESAEQSDIEAADIAWIDAQAAYAEAGYSLETFEARR